MRNCINCKKKKLKGNDLWCSMKCKEEFFNKYFKGTKVVIEGEDAMANWKIAMLWHEELVEKNKAIEMIMRLVDKNKFVDFMAECYDMRQENKMLRRKLRDIEEKEQ